MKNKSWDHYDIGTIRRRVDLSFKQTWHVGHQPVFFPDSFVLKQYVSFALIFFLSSCIAEGMSTVSCGIFHVLLTKKSFTYVPLNSSSGFIVEFVSNVSLEKVNITGNEQGKAQPNFSFTTQLQISSTLALISNSKLNFKFWLQPQTWSLNFKIKIQSQT